MLKTRKFKSKLLNNKYSPNIGFRKKYIFKIYCQMIDGIRKGNIQNFLNFSRETKNCPKNAIG